MDNETTRVTTRQVKDFAQSLGQGDIAPRQVEVARRLINGRTLSMDLMPGVLIGRVTAIAFLVRREHRASVTVPHWRRLGRRRYLLQINQQGVSLLVRIKLPSPIRILLRWARVDRTVWEWRVLGYKPMRRRDVKQWLNK